jgi:GT2 family glycosyltransferase
MFERMIDLSIILVNWNAAPVLIECLRRALPELNTVSGECIVVDNGSSGEDLLALEREFPQLQIIANPRNLGFARAVNQGIKKSRGRYLLLLNPDAFLSAGSLRALITFLDAEPKVGIVGPRIVNLDGSLQGSARAFPRLATGLFGRTSFLSRLFPRNPFTGRQVLALNGQQDRSQPVDWVSGACMFLRRQVLEEVGLLDERFFLYWEDADICWRARQAGWLVVYYPHTDVTHLIGACSRRAPVRSLVAFH